MFPCLIGSGSYLHEYFFFCIVCVCCIYLEWAIYISTRNTQKKKHKMERWEGEQIVINAFCVPDTTDPNLTEDPDGSLMQYPG